jgi:hypothetical protein
MPHRLTSSVVGCPTHNSARVPLAVPDATAARTHDHQTSICCRCRAAQTRARTTRVAGSALDHQKAATMIMFFGRCRAHSSAPSPLSSVPPQPRPAIPLAGPPPPIPVSCVSVVSYAKIASRSLAFNYQLILRRRRRWIPLNDCGPLPQAPSSAVAASTSKTLKMNESSLSRIPLRRLITRWLSFRISCF